MPSLASDTRQIPAKMMGFAKSSTHPSIYGFGMLSAVAAIDYGPAQPHLAARAGNPP